MTIRYVLLQIHFARTTAYRRFHQRIWLRICIPVDRQLRGKFFPFRELDLFFEHRAVVRQRVAGARLQLSDCCALVSAIQRHHACPTQSEVVLQCHAGSWHLARSSRAAQLMG